MGLKCRTSAESNRSTARASRSSTAGSCSLTSVLSFPATIASARGSENQRAATDSTVTHHAIRHNNHASPGRETTFRAARIPKPQVFSKVLILLVWALPPAWGSALSPGSALRSGLCPNRPKAERGAQPNFSLHTDGKAEPCLTSGGGAKSNDDRKALLPTTTNPVSLPVAEPIVSAKQRANLTSAATASDDHTSRSFEFSHLNR